MSSYNLSVGKDNTGNSFYIALKLIVVVMCFPPWLLLFLWLLRLQLLRLDPRLPLFVDRLGPSMLFLIWKYIIELHVTSGREVAP